MLDMAETLVERSPLIMDTIGECVRDVTGRLVTYDEVMELAPLFEHDELRPCVQIRCAGLEEGYDGYNPSPIIAVRVRRTDQAETNVIIIRTERRQQPFVPETRFCRYDESGECHELEEIARMPWEDPHVVVLPDGRIVMSGVRVDWNADNPSKADRFATEFYIGESLDTMRFLGRSPYGHKDSRLIVHKDGTIGLYIRPQQRLHEGKIAYTELADIEELAGTDETHTAQAVYERATLLGAGIFGEGTWGGPNDAHDLGNGWDMILGHIATTLKHESGTVVRDDRGEAYVVYSGFILLHHRPSGRVFVTRPHALAEDFPWSGQCKRDTLERVVFSAGIHSPEFHQDTGHLVMVASYGLRDALACVRGVRSRRALQPLLDDLALAS